MPSKSEKQRRTMAAAAHDPAFAEKVGIPQNVAKEFNAADTAKRPKAGNHAIMRDPFPDHPAQRDKARKATYGPSPDKCKETHVGRKGLAKGY